jgi:hypothetical protein
MKTTTEKTFDAVKFMRAQREKLSEKLAKMSKEEIIEYFRKKKLENSVKPSVYPKAGFPIPLRLGSCVFLSKQNESPLSKICQ